MALGGQILYILLLTVKAPVTLRDNFVIVFFFIIVCNKSTNNDQSKREDCKFLRIFIGNLLQTISFIKWNSASVTLYVYRLINKIYNGQGRIQELSLEGGVCRRIECYSIKTIHVLTICSRDDALCAYFIIFFSYIDTKSKLGRF
jgi:hypothetical protein